MSTFVTATELAELDPSKRVNYTLGMIIGADDLRQDQRYLTARDERHQRTLHGWGVVSGLVVDVDPDDRLRVNPGLAVDGIGRDICLERPQCADLLAWLNAHADGVDTSSPVDVWVLLCYDTCETELLPVPSGPCQSLDDSLAASRVVDSFALELSLTDPVRRQDRAHPTFVDVMTGLVDDAADVDDKRSALQRFVAERGVEPAYAGPCLNALGDPCVPLGRIRLDLALDGETIVYATEPTSADIEMSGRPILLSSTFLQEWLLRVEGGGIITTAPDLSILELNDTATPGTPPDTDPATADVPDHAVLLFDARSGLWLTETLRLDLLDDVDVSAALGEGVYLGWDTGSGTWQPKTVTHPEVEVPQVDGDFVHSRKDSMIAIVAAGVVELDTQGLSESPFEPEALQGALRTEYGGLEYHFGFGSASHGMFQVGFGGLAETFERYGRLLGREFVVKASIEHGGRIATVQVVAVRADGIVLRYATTFDDERDAFAFDKLHPEFGLDLSLDRSPLAVHIEVSVFDDREIRNAGPIRETDHRAEVGALWEPRP